MRKMCDRICIASLICFCLASVQTTWAQVKTTQLAADNYFQRLKSVTLAHGDPRGLVFNVSGRVLDPDGEPVPDAVVVLRESSTKRFSAEGGTMRVDSRHAATVNDVFARTRTDDQGRYQFENAAAQSLFIGYRSQWQHWYWSVAAASPTGDLGWSHLKKTFNGPEQVTKTRNVNLRRSVPLSGKLLSTHGLPVGNAIVRLSTLDRVEPAGMSLMPPDDRFDANASSMQLLQQTGPDGTFQFPSIPEKLAIAVSASHDDHTFGFHRITNSDVPAVAIDGAASTASSTAPVLKSPAVIKALEVVKIRGRVIDQTGKPIVGVHVRKQSTTLIAVTDKNGQFQWPIPNPSLTKYSRSAVHAHAKVHFIASVPKRPFIHESVYFSTAELLAGKSQTIVLKRGCELSGKVICQQTGEPLPGVRVGAANVGAAGSSRVYTSLTDSDGVYRIVTTFGELAVGLSGPIAGFDVPRLNWSKDLQDNDLQNNSPLIRVVDLKARTKVNLESFLVEPLPSIDVFVVGPNNQPVPHARVNAFYQRKFENNRLGGEQDLAPIATTDQDGKCQLLPMITDWKFGTIRVKAEMEGVHFYGQAFTAPEPNEPTNVRLKRAWDFSGRVLMDGEPVRNTKVSLMRSTHGGTGLALRSVRSQNIGSTTTDLNGEYKFVVAPDEAYSVSVDDPTSTWRQRSSARNSQVNEHQYRFGDIEFTSPNITANGTGTIRGVVVDFDGTPIVNASVYLIRESMQKHASTQTNARGEFELTELRGGKVSLHAHAAPKATQSPPTATRAAATVGDEDVEITLDSRLSQPIAELETVQVVPVKQVLVDHDGRVTLSGHVVDENDQPIADAVVRIHSAKSRAAKGEIARRVHNNSSYPDCGKTTLTDDTGRFNIDGLADDLLFDLAIGAQTYLGRIVRSVDPQVPGGKFDLSKMQDLDPRQSFSSRVVDVDGKPIAGAAVKVSRMVTMTSRVQQPMAGISSTAVTDHNGNYVLQIGVPIRSMQLEIIAGGYASTTVNNARHGAPPRDTTLAAGASVAGRLMLGDRPIAGVAMELISLDRTQLNWQFGIPTTTNAHGVFRWDNLAPDAVYSLSTPIDREVFATLPTTLIKTPTSGELADLGNVAAEPGHKVTFRFVTENRRPIPAKSYCYMQRTNSRHLKLINIPEQFAPTVRFRGMPSEVLTITFQVPGYEVIDVKPRCQLDVNKRYSIFCDEDKSFTFTLRPVVEP